MANYADLKSDVGLVIRPNGTQAIAGGNHQTEAYRMIDALGAHYIQDKVAPTFDPGNPDGNFCYFSDGPGIYTNFNNQKVSAGELWMFRGTGTVWVPTLLFKVDSVTVIPGPFEDDADAITNGLTSGDIYKSNGADGYGPRISFVE